MTGWVLVIQVTLNRVRDDRFLTQYDEVVKQGLTYESGFPIRDKCQFSWYCDGKSDKILNLEVYDRILGLDRLLDTKMVILILQMVITTHYHVRLC